MQLKVYLTDVKSDDSRNAKAIELPNCSPSSWSEDTDCVNNTDSEAVAYFLQSQKLSKQEKKTLWRNLKRTR